MGEKGTEGSARSWLAHKVQLKVSPTYAEPNEGGRFSIGVKRKGSGFVCPVDLYARDAGIVLTLLAVPAATSGRGCCVTRDARDSLDIVAIR